MTVAAVVVGGSAAGVGGVGEQLVTAAAAREGGAQARGLQGVPCVATGHPEAPDERHSAQPAPCGLDWAVAVQRTEDQANGRHQNQAGQAVGQRGAWRRGDHPHRHRGAACTAVHEGCRRHPVAVALVDAAPAPVAAGAQNARGQTTPWRRSTPRPARRHRPWRRCRGNHTTIGSSGVRICDVHTTRKQRTVQWDAKPPAPQQKMGQPSWEARTACASRALRHSAQTKAPGCTVLRVFRRTADAAELQQCVGLTRTGTRQKPVQTTHENAPQKGTVRR